MPLRLRSARKGNFGRRHRLRWQAGEVIAGAVRTAIGDGAMKSLDRTTARALAEAGYLPLAGYVAMIREDEPIGPSLVPDAADDPHDLLLPDFQPAQPVRMS